MITAEIMLATILHQIEYIEGLIEDGSTEGIFVEIEEIKSEIKRFLKIDD